MPDELYTFVDNYIRECFEEEKVLASTDHQTVIKARHRKSRKRYIVRRLTGTGQAFLKLRGIGCENLPRVYEVAETISNSVQEGASRIIVLEEYIQGDSLDMLIDGGEHLTKHQARNIALQLCDALYALHSLGIIHRDVKPSNVILSGSRAVLIDFDAARICRPDSEKVRDTQILGTVGYAPPEQYGFSETDFRADIYAMGVLINEMLTGVHPSETLAPGRWGRIIGRCTMISPDKRYRTIEELKGAI